MFVVYLAASAAAASASLLYEEVTLPTGPTMITTLGLAGAAAVTATPATGRISPATRMEAARTLGASIRTGQGLPATVVGTR